jgi:hypothetical protein
MIGGLAQAGLHLREHCDEGMGEEDIRSGARRRKRPKMHLFCPAARGAGSQSRPLRRRHRQRAGLGLRVQGHAAVVQILVKGGLADAQTPGYVADAQLAGLLEQFGRAGRAQGLLGQARLAPADSATGAGGGQPGQGALADEFAFKLRERGKQVEHEPALAPRPC